MNSAAHERKAGGDNQKPQRGQPDQGVVRDERGEDEPKNRERAQRSSGLKSQQDAAQTQPPSPGQPAHGE
jgi:hypothetical protein